ncbi:uncharacterized protein [Porites lutea]|uniref:uncharacterized protein n=1 Tax=Porites lutea TaxID=51062 RepID=UPI003CC65AB9
MRAPSSTSLFSKAYNFLKGKTSQNDENFYAKTRSPFPSEIYHNLSEPIDQKRGPSISRKNRQTLGEISNRPWSVAMDREQKQQSLSKGRFSPRTMVKNYWTTSREDKKLNNELQPQPKNGRSQDQEYDDIEEEGIFKIQLIKPHNGFLGIVLVGGADTPLQYHYVNDILPNSSASKSGRVRAGDQLLEANGHSLGGKTHAEALTIFRSLPAVVELLVARTKDANRSVLEWLKHERKDNQQVNNNIALPDRRRSVIEEAAKTSVIPRSPATVVDVTKTKCPYVKAVKRNSRVSSFVGTEEDKVVVNSTVSTQYERQKRNQEYHGFGNGKEDNKIRRMGEVFMPSTDLDNEDPEVFTDGHVITFDLPQIQEDMTLPYATIRRKQTLNVSLKRRSVIERGDITATWPAFTTKQRLPLPWDSFATPRPATVGRSSSVRFRRSIAATSASTLTLHQASSNRKSTGKHYIDKKTLTFEIERANTSADWGFSIGGGVFSPYGDLPIFISEISVSGGGPKFLQKGDEIVAFSGDSFEGITFLEAEKMLRICPRKRATVTIKRKYLERCQNPQSNPYIEAWSSMNSTKITPGTKQRRRPKSVHY